MCRRRFQTHILKRRNKWPNLILCKTNVSKFSITKRLKTYFQQFPVYNFTEQGLFTEDVDFERNFWDLDSLKIISKFE